MQIRNDGVSISVTVLSGHWPMGLHSIIRKAPAIDLQYLCSSYPIEVPWIME